MRGGAILKRIGALALALALLSQGVSAAAEPGPVQVSAKAAILIDAGSGRALYELNPDERMLIASTTKIMTALVALENCAPGERVKIDSRSAGREGSSMYLREGESYTVEELLYGLMLCSGNDAAAALALHTSGSEEAFAGLMNEKARSLGLTNTRFANASGLDAEGHYSSARDMARLAAQAMEDDGFRRIVSSKSAVVHGREIYNHNKLLTSYDGCIGVKTGYTKAAGRTLVSCAERDGLRLVCVTLCDRDDWRDHAALYDWAFEKYESRSVAAEDTRFRVPAAGGEGAWIEAMPEEEFRAAVERGAEVEIGLELPPLVIAPVRRGEPAGRLYASSGGVELGSVELVYAEDMPVYRRPGPLRRAMERLFRPLYLTGE